LSKYHVAGRVKLDQDRCHQQQRRQQQQSERSEADVEAALYFDNLAGALTVSPLKSGSFAP
jgi:hypothetical protein